MNVFIDKKISEDYDNYYSTEFGKKVDEIEKKLITELLIGLPKANMLELGCGTGHWTEFFVNQGFNVIATDISEPMLNIAKKKNINAELLIADAENLPFDKENFELISTITMLEFVDSIIKVVREIERVLKKKGFLIIGCLNKYSVLWENKENDSIFKFANFYSISDISEIFNNFEIIKKLQGVYLNDKYEICDFDESKSNIEPVFNAILLRRKS